jgi:hypothetical protein
VYDITGEWTYNMETVTVYEEWEEGVFVVIRPKTAVSNGS